MISTSSFKNGSRILYEGTPYIITEFQHVKPGKGGAFVRTKLKNLLNGSVQEKTFRAGEKLDEPDIQDLKYEYLYQAERQLCFMNSETYEQIFLTEEQTGKEKELLKEGTIVTILLFNGSPVSLTLPMFVELEVVQTDPGVKGDTASGGSKPATIETGGTIKVPLYISEGDVIKIDTRTSSFVERTRS